MACQVLRLESGTEASVLALLVQKYEYWLTQDGLTARVPERLERSAASTNTDSNNLLYW